MPLGFLEAEFGVELFLGLDPAVSADVQDAQSALSDNPSDKQPAMAFGGVFLAAEDGHPGTSGLVDQLSDRPAKLVRCGHAAVEHSPGLVVTGGIVGASSQPIAEKAVFDAASPQRGPDGFPIELRGVSRVRIGADVGQHFDPMPLQEVEKDVQRMIGVSDRPDRVGRIG